LPEDFVQVLQDALLHLLRGGSGIDLTKATRGLEHLLDDCRRVDNTFRLDLGRGRRRRFRLRAEKLTVDRLRGSRRRLSLFAGLLDLGPWRVGRCRCRRSRVPTRAAAR
jgi:hypothetical protein